MAWDVAPGLDDAAVPALVLQPLVENALKYGVGARSSGGKVAIGASAASGTLTLRVTDNGPGLARGQKRTEGSGIGLASTRGRLERLYGSAHHFSIGEAPGGGVDALVEIPYRNLEVSE